MQKKIVYIVLDLHFTHSSSHKNPPRSLRAKKICILVKIEEDEKAFHCNEVLHRNYIEKKYIYYATHR